MKIGIIGIGNMGLAMAGRLLEQRWRVAVRDINAQRERLARAQGAAVCGTPAELAAQADCVIVCVVDASQAETALFDPQNGVVALGRQPSVLLCPTIAPAAAEAIGNRLAEYGLHCIDAPMSGGPARARQGRMSLMVACDDARFEHHRRLLNTLADPVFRVGNRIGDGARTKLVNNLLAAVNLAGAVEALALAEQVGLDPARTLDVIEQSSGQSWIGSERLRRALAGDLEPRANTSLLNKDARLALGMAGEVGFDASVGAAASSLFARACESGLAQHDDASLFEFLRGSRTASIQP